MNIINRTLSIDDIKTTSQEQIIELYKQGYRLEENQNILNQNILNQNILNQNILNQNILNQNILNQNILNQNIPITGTMSSLETNIPGGTLGTILLIAGALVFAYFMLVVKYKVEGSAAKMAGQKYVATSSSSNRGWF